jgi:nucleotide-binding universal stress UspA family protein
MVKEVVMIRRILIPTDGSSCSEQAVQQGLELAQALGADVTFLFAVEDPAATMYAAPELTAYRQDLLDGLRAAGEGALARATELANRAGVVSEQMLVERVRPVDAIHEAEIDHDLVVLGTHGRRGFDRFVFGSVAEGALRRSQIPYMMVRSGRDVEA